MPSGTLRPIGSGCAAAAETGSRAVPIASPIARQNVLRFMVLPHLLS